MSTLPLLVSAKPGPPREPQDQGISAGHRLLDHELLWRYLNPAFARPWATDDGRPPLFADYGSATDPEPLLAQGWLVVLVGASDSPLWRALSETQGGRVLVFEPDPRRFTRFSRAVGPARLARSGARFILGEPDFLSPPLAQVIGEDDLLPGFPLVFVEEGAGGDLLDYARRVALAVEILYFRHVLYQVEGQFSRESLPLVPMKRGIMYDQLKHAYENVWASVAHAGRLDDLKNLFPGRTAVVVAAGPDLPRRIEYLRSVADKAVIICVNSALKKLLEAGITPHVVVINDTAVEVEGSLILEGQLENTLLVAHCLAFSAPGTFARLYFFDEFRPEAFGHRRGLPMHGSVATAAFSLARWLGCVRVIFAGLSLASTNPHRMEYGDGRHGPGDMAQAAVQGRFPELYPVSGPHGERLYTSLNFLDVKHWLLDAVRESGLEVVNVSAESIFHGPGVAYDPAPQVDDAGDPARLIAAMPLPSPACGLDQALSFLSGERAFWTSISANCRELAAALPTDDAAVPRAEQLLDYFHEHNLTFLMQRSPGFTWAYFFSEYYREGVDAFSRRGALVSFLHGACRLAEDYLEVLGRQQVYLRTPPGAKPFWPFSPPGPAS